MRGIVFHLPAHALRRELACGESALHHISHCAERSQEMVMGKMNIPEAELSQALHLIERLLKSLSEDDAISQYVNQNLIQEAYDFLKRHGRDFLEPGFSE